jgi:hypothetical protein
MPSARPKAVASRNLGAVAFLAALGACGCSVSDEYAVQGADASTSFDAKVEASDASISFGASACRQCVVKSCSREVTDCRNDTECMTYLNCLDGCEVGSNGAADQACAGRCWNASAGNSSPSLSTLSTCMTDGPGASCAACGDGEGGIGGILHQNCPVDHDAANSCAECVHEKCCETRLACLNDPSCSALSDCEANCHSGVSDDAGATAEPPEGGGPYSCDLWCGAQTNPSLDKWAQLVACGDFACQGASECGGGDTCTACIAQYCEIEDLALSATPDGYLFFDCTAQCATTDPACTQCGTNYPSVTSALSAFSACSTKHCPSCN